MNFAIFTTWHQLIIILSNIQELIHVRNKKKNLSKFRCSIVSVIILLSFYYTDLVICKAITSTAKKCARQTPRLYIDIWIILTLFSVLEYIHTMRHFVVRPNLSHAWVAPHKTEFYHCASCVSLSLSVCQNCLHNA